MIMHKIKTALKEKNDSLLAASKAQLEEVFNDIHNKDYDHEVDRAVAKPSCPLSPKNCNLNSCPFSTRLSKASTKATTMLS